MFQSKEECCKEMFGWAPIENCLGDGWVEVNYVIGSQSPTMSPSMTPTGMPSSMPSTTFAPSPAPTVVKSDAPSGQPSYAPSSMLSDAPSSMPSLVPTFAPSTEVPTTLFPTEAPTTPAPTDKINVVTSSQTASSFQDISPNFEAISSSGQASTTSSSHADPNASFLVELLGWANSDTYTESTGSTHDPPRPETDSFTISEIVLPIVEDTTISQLRPNLNFAGNSALAVDGGSTNGADQTGDGLGEKFDSLLKFDIGMIDKSRLIEKAVLRIFALGNCRFGGTFVTTTDSSWDHKIVDWDSAPVGDGYEIGTIETANANEWYELDVMAALSWNDSISAFSSNENFLSVRISSVWTGRCLFSSMENGMANAPYMSVKYGHADVIQEFSSPLEMPPVSGQFLLLRSTDDSSIDALNPTAKLGMQPTLEVSYDAASRITDTLIRFDLTELAGSIPLSSVLNLYAESNCTSAGTIMTTEGDSSWSESDVTWTSAPRYLRDEEGGGFNVGTFGQVTWHKWYGFDVKNAVKQAVTQGKAAVTFRISTSSQEECKYSSRESGRDPKLMVAF
jgi:hypothetical protein